MMKTKLITLLALFALSFVNAQTLKKIASNSLFAPPTWEGLPGSLSDIYRFGKVGIGITNPLSDFHVNGALRITGTPVASGFGGPVLIFGESGDPNAENGNYYIEYIPSQGLNFGIPWPNPNYGNYDLFLSTTRKVGMGTNNFNCNDCSSYRLFVKDGIRTEKIKVEIASIGGWADYVFDKNYYLMSLKEVDNYITKYKHLPEMPTAEEAVKNGVELKKMNVLLLKKVEELTLHTIKQQKLIEKINKEIKILKEQVNH